MGARELVNEGLGGLEVKLIGVLPLGVHSSNSSFGAVVVLLGSLCSDVDLLVGLLDLSRGV